MIKNRLKLILPFIILSFSACQSPESLNDKLNVVTTTTMITDMVRIIGGEDIQTDGLMGTGVDPHYYKATEGDVHKLANANIIFHNGLHLEGKMEQIFENMDRSGVEVVAVTEDIDLSELIESSDFAGNYDPHFWFDIDLWIKSSEKVAQTLAELDTIHRSNYVQRQKNYADSLMAIKSWVEQTLVHIADSSRVLVTAHDAFSYFGRYFDFKVKGLQGITTTAEAGVKDVQMLSDFIVQRKIKAIFVESTVNRRNVEALQQAVKNKGFEVSIGGELFSDALGDENTDEGTYIGMYLHNVNTLVNALK